MEIHGKKNESHQATPKFNLVSLFFVAKILIEYAQPVLLLLCIVSCLILTLYLSPPPPPPPLILPLSVSWPHFDALFSYPLILSIFLSRSTFPSSSSSDFTFLPLSLIIRPPPSLSFILTLYLPLSICTYIIYTQTKEILLILCRLSTGIFNL